MQELLTLSNIVIVFAIFLLILYWLHAFVLLYHLIRFGVGTRPKQAAIIFLGGSFVLFVLVICAAAGAVFLSS